MDKILIEVFVPAVEQTFDVLIPLSLKLFEIAGLLSGAVAELSNEYFNASMNPLICDRESGEVLDVNLSAQELGLQTGSVLMLI